MEILNDITKVNLLLRLYMVKIKRQKINDFLYNKQNIKNLFSIKVEYFRYLQCQIIILVFKVILYIPKDELIRDVLEI